MGKYNIEHHGSVDVYKVTRKPNPLPKVIGAIIGILFLIGLANSGGKTEAPSSAPASYNR